MCKRELFTHALHTLIKTQTRLHANHKHVQGIRERKTDPPLARSHHAEKHELRKQVSDQGEEHKQNGFAKSKSRSSQSCKDRCRADAAKAEVHRDMARRTE